MSNEKAFTMIELILTLVLIAVLTPIAGLGLYQIAEGYVFARKNAETVQRAQVGMARVVKELSAAENATAGAAAITTANETSVTYTRRASSGSSTFITNTIDLSGATVRIQIGAAAASSLIDNVNTAGPAGSEGFKLDYYDAAGGALSGPPWPVAVPGKIRQIHIRLTVRGANNTLSTFNNRVNIQEPY